MLLLVFPYAEKVCATEINNSAYIVFYIDQVIDDDNDYTTWKIMKINKEWKKEIFENKVAPINQPISFKKKWDYMYWSYFKTIPSEMYYLRKNINDNYTTPAIAVSALEFHNIPWASYLGSNDISINDYYASIWWMYEQWRQPYKWANIELSQNGFNLVKDWRSEHLFWENSEVTWNGFFWVDEQTDNLYYKSWYYDGWFWRTFWWTYGLQNKQKTIYEFGEDIPTHSSFDTDSWNSAFCSWEWLKIKENSGYINNLISTNWIVSSYWMHGVEKHCLIFSKNVSSLTLLSSTPANSSIGVVTNPLIALNFSKPLDQASVPGNIILQKTGGNAVDTLATSYSWGTVVFHAIAPLDKNTSYTVLLKTGLKDTSWNPLGADTSFSFTTGSDPAAPSPDGTVASTVLSPICSLAGYSMFHPECSLLNALVVDTNNQVVLNGSAGGSPAWDPVSLATGEFTCSNTLIHAVWDGLDYDFSLSYKSQAYSNGPVGISWDHSYNVSLRENADGSVTYSDGKFGTYTYVRNADGNFGRLPGIEADLVKADTGYELRFVNGTVYSFGSNSKISSIRDKGGHTLMFAYDADNRLVSTTDTLGHVFSYAYHDHGRLKSVTDFSGRSVTLSYYSETDADGSAYDLKSVTIDNGIDPETSSGWRNKKTISFTYQKDSTSEILSHNILTLVDSLGKEYVKNTYDVNDRVISQKFGDGTLTYAYETVGGTGPDTRHVTKTTATNKRGMKSEFSYDANGNTATKKLFDGNGGALTTSYTYGSGGKVATETKPLGNGTSYRYDSVGRIVEKRLKADMSKADDDGADIVTGYEYGSNFSVPTKITDPSGNIIVTTLDAKGNLVETKIPGVKKADDSTYDVVNTFVYDTTGHLESKTDGVGNTTSYEYHLGRLVKTIEWSGDETVVNVFSYDDHGNLLSTTDGEGNVRKFTYDQYDRLVASLSSEGILREIGYDANNNKTEEKVHLENGKILKSTSAYDILDQIVGNTVGSDESDQRATSLVRDANGNVTETVDASGLKTKYAYDIFDRVIEKRVIADATDASKDIVTHFGYDTNGNIVSATDARGAVTAYEYDRFDRMAASTDALGTKTLLVYDKSGNTVSQVVRDSAGKILSKTDRVFDGLGHVVKETRGDIGNGSVPTITTVDYDGNGKPVKGTDAKGNSTSVAYDTFGRKKSMTDALGNQTVFAYDKRGLVVKQEVKSADGKSIITAYSYDRDGRLVSKTDGLGDKTVSLYNTLGQVTQVTDALGNKTDYRYDVFGNTLSETKYLSGTSVTTSYEYDKSNNRTELTDAKGNVTTYTYDSVNRLVRETLADGSFVAYEYDAAGNIVKKTDANGTVVNNAYDTLGRLVKRSIQRGANVLGVTEENYSYDSLGRLTRSTDSEGNVLAFAYDAFGRLVSESQNGKVVQTGYDANSNITSLSYPSGKKVVREYDVLSRLINIRHPELVSGSSAPIATYSYNSLTLDTLTLGNGAKTSYGYDAILRLKELTNTSIPSLRAERGNPGQDTIISKLTFSYDGNSNILGNGHDTYSYDSLNRLTGAGYEPMEDKKSMTESFTYDPMGSRLTSLFTQSKDMENGKEKGKKDDKARMDATSYTSNILNQYTSVDKTKLMYDKNGNLVNNGKFQLFYDYRNRLVKVVKVGEKDEKGEKEKKDGKEKNESKENKDQFVAKYSYDIFGRRLSKETRETLVKYIYSNQDAVEESEYKKDDGKLTLKGVRENVYGQGIDDILVTVVTTTDGKKKTESRYFYQKNQLGSITAITDEKGKMGEEYRYDVFGKAYVRNGKSSEWREFRESKVGNSRLFTGREYDGETGLYYYRARFYSAEMGRFISRDPIGIRDNVNLYSYVGNSPVMFVDSMGREKRILQVIVDRMNYYWAYLENNPVLVDTFADMILNPDKLNFKVNSDFLAHSEWIDSSCTAIENNCWKKIQVDGMDINLATLGNIAFAYAWAKFWYSISTIKLGALVVTWLAGDAWAKKDGVLNNEEWDWPYYDIWFNLAASTETWQLTVLQFKNALLNITR